jgi:hypothetical protein
MVLNLDGKAPKFRGLRELGCKKQSEKLGYKHSLNEFLTNLFYKRKGMAIIRGLEIRKRYSKFPFPKKNLLANNATKMATNISSFQFEWLKVSSSNIIEN